MLGVDFDYAELSADIITVRVVSLFANERARSRIASCPARTTPSAQHKLHFQDPLWHALRYPLTVRDFRSINVYLTSPGLSAELSSHKRPPLIS